MPTNPYQPPSTAELGSHSSEPTSVPPLVVEHLRCTRPWVRFCSLAGYTTSGFLVIIALFTLRSMIGNWPIDKTILLSGFYLVLAILFIIPSLYLSRYEKSITHLLVSNRLEDLEQALADQRSFWKQMALMILLLVVIYLLTIAYSAIVLLSGKL